MRPRILPCLTLNERRLEKTQKFKNPIYLGDPYVAVRIFNDFEVDELIVLDYTADSPDYTLLGNLSSEAFMPMSYGGGINSIKDVEKVISLGFEKISLNRLVLTNLAMVKEIVKEFGSSTVIASVDVKKNFFKKHEIYCPRVSKQLRKIELGDHIKLIEDAGVGELFVTSVDLESSLSGPDLDLARQVSGSVDMPVLYQGGVGGLQDMFKLLSSTETSGIVCGAYFVLNGRLRSPLISYLTVSDFEELEFKIHGK